MVREISECACVYAYIGHAREHTYVALQSGELVAELKQKKPALCMTFVTEKEIAIGSEDFGIHLWDYAKGTERVHLKGHESRVRVLRTFAVGSKTYIVSGATDGTVLVWGANARTRPSKTYSPH